MASRDPERDETVPSIAALGGDALSAPGVRQREAIRARLFDTPIEPEAIGRHEIVRKLGAGAVGVVYLCRDPELARDVAVKVLRERRADTARLRREAQAMAQLSHPNVAAVYEVGEHDGSLFLAMELVHGVTLRTWQIGRPASEVLDAYMQAGHGLAAAHRSGIVHRDFKPDNAMMGADGRVRVLDFGLARATDLDEQERTIDPDVASARAPAVLEPGLTGTGTTLGTPAYMPPEQLRSAAVDARADQFAFCVALFEALCGARPFVGSSTFSLAEAIRRGDVRWPADVELARSLRAVLVRGLAAEPGDRFRDMDALLTAMARSRRSRRTAIALGIGAGVLALAGAALARPGDACRDAGDALPTMARVDRERLPAPDVTAIEARTQEWRTEAIALCRTPTLPDAPLRTACLADVRASIDHAIVRGVATDRPLLALDDCLAQRLRGTPPIVVAPEDADAAQEILAALKQTQAAGQAGDSARAAAIVGPAVERARAIGAPGLLAQALLLQAATASQLGDMTSAERLATESFELARASGHDRLALRAATDLVDLVGHDLRRRDDGEHWARTGEALAIRLSADDLSRSRLFVNRGLMRLEFGERESARVDLEQARLAAVAAGGPDTKLQLPALGNLAHLALLEGEHERALDLMATQIRIAQAELGPQHPDLVHMFGNRSLILIELERWVDAQADLDRAQAICDTLAIDRLCTGLHVDRTRLLYERGELVAARREIERALEGLAVAHAADHPRVLMARLRRAEILVAQGDDASAAPLLHDTLVLAEARHGHEDDDVAEAHVALAGIAARAGDDDRAWHHLEQAEPGLVRHRLDCSRRAAMAVRADVLVARGDAAAAVTMLRDRGPDPRGCSRHTIAQLERALARATE